MDDAREPKNIFVLGYDHKHGKDIARIPDVERFRFHPLLSSDELVYQEDYDLDEMIEKARDILRSFQGKVDGIVCHWDFPATSIAAILNEEFGLLGPSLEAILKCSHKYWSRLEQSKAAPDNTPNFCAIDPFAEDPLASVTLDYPFWIKPIKAYGSALGFMIANQNEFQEAIETVREEIDRIGTPFNTILDRVTLPAAVADVRGNYLIAEQFMKGVEFAPEGSVQHGRFRAHGVIDMVMNSQRTSFLRYEYPSRVPDQVQARGIDVARKVLDSIGFDNGCFNMEFFWNEQTDELLIIEINPRISQSHSYQFEQVDGMSNHEIAVHVATGDEPVLLKGEGPYKQAAKCFLRHYSDKDARVIRTPSGEDLKALSKVQPETEVDVIVENGQRLSTLLDQDSYSYVLAEVHVAAHSTDELVAKFERAIEFLSFELEEMELPAGGS